MDFRIYLFAMAALIFYAWFATRKKGTRVLLEWYKVVDNKLIRVKPMKKFIGVNVSAGVNEELILPKSMSKFSIQGVDYDELSMTDRGTPILKLLQVGEGLFVPMKFYGNVLKNKAKEDPRLVEVMEKETKARRSFLSKKPKKSLHLSQYLAHFDIHVIDKSVIAWKENKVRELESRHKEKQDKWAKLGPIVTMIGVSFIAFLILFTAYKEAGEITREAMREAGQQIDETQSITEKLLDFNNFKTNVADKEAPSDPESAPPGTQ